MSGNRYPPHVPQHFTPKQYEKWRNSNDMTREKDYTEQTKFLNSLITRDTFLSATGFDAKKVMWAARIHPHTHRQFQVNVSVFKCEYFKENQGPRNCLKVGGVVFPLLKPESANERVYEQIVAERIPGSYLYWKVFNFNQKAKFDFSIANGPLFNVQIRKTKYPNDPIIYWGRTCGIYPYYRHNKYDEREYDVDNGYVPYLGFNLEDHEFRDYQHRFTDTEREPGIREANPTSGIGLLYNCCLSLVDLYDLRVNALSAIYVPNCVTLTVSVVNRSVDSNIKRPREGAEFHERWVIQAGGLVVIHNYPLYYRFMNDQNGHEFRFQNKQTYELKRTVIEEANFINMRNLVQEFDYPLIVLGEPDQGNRQVRHYAGYFLDIKNYDQNKRAVLNIPMGGTFREVHDLTPNLTNPDKPRVPGIDFMEREWNEPNEPFRRYAGPFAAPSSVAAIDWTKRDPYVV